MSKNNNSGGSGCLVMFIVGYIILAIIGGLSNAVGPTATLIIIGIVIGIIVLISKLSKKASEEEKIRQAAQAERKAKEQAAEAERQRNLRIVNAIEHKTQMLALPSSMSFSNKEEEYVNVTFREFSKKNNDAKTTQSHIDYLNKKIPALLALGKVSEASEIQKELDKSKADLLNAHAQKGRAFESQCVNAIWKVNDIKNAFTSFASRLPNDRVEWISDFFQSPKVKVVKITDSSALIFTPLYVLHYSGIANNLELITYEELNVNSEVTTELLDGYTKFGDEIARISYLHTNSDGSRDMRYSLSNNPSYTYVYRGKVSFTANWSTAIINLNNKTATQEYEKQVKAFVSMISGKYKPIVKKLLSHDETIVNASSIEDALTRESELQKEKEKREKERKEEAEAKQRKEQAEREAAVREKQRKEDFLKSLTIIDGTLTNWYGNDRNFVLPEGLVTTIGTAFRWKRNLNSVTLPEGITTIQANAFHGSTDLKRITIPSTVTDIGKEAFMGCTSLSEIKLPKGIKSITSQMFAKCASLKTISVPTGVRKIERGAFSGCSSLQEIVLPNGVITVEDDAFENCTGLKKVILPNSVIKLGRNIFNGCMSLETVELGNGIKHIPNACFNNQQRLKTVSVAADVVEIGERAFKNCQELTSIEFIDVNKTASSKGMEFEMLISGSAKSESKLFTLDSLERVGKSAFENCFVFRGLDIKEGLMAIGDYAFANCRSIKKVNLPKSINTFGIGVFQGCSSLAMVNGSENVEWHKKNSFIGTPWLATQAEDGYVIHDGYLEAYTGTETNVTIPENIKVIGKNAFDGNAYLTTVNIPMGVTTIEELAFANCRKLKLIQIADSVSRIEDNAFANDSGFIIQCTRGSAASSFRIRNKIAGEYIAKTKSPEPVTRKSTKRTRSTVGDGLSGLSEDELRVIMEMRREKLAQKKAEAERSVEPEKTEYTLSEVDPNKIAVALLSDNRKITNNIFNLKFIQCDSADSGKEIAEYETFVTDSYGQVISNIKTIKTNKTGTDLTHKVSYSLSAQERFDKSAAYYVMLRYKGSGTNILSKTQYQINIEFASDFDF